MKPRCDAQGAWSSPSPPNGKVRAPREIVVDRSSCAAHSIGDRPNPRNAARLAQLLLPYQRSPNRRRTPPSSDTQDLGVHFGVNVETATVRSRSVDVRDVDESRTETRAHEQACRARRIRQRPLCPNAERRRFRKGVDRVPSPGSARYRSAWQVLRSRTRSGRPQRRGSIAVECVVDDDACAWNVVRGFAVGGGDAGADADVPCVAPARARRCVNRAAEAISDQSERSLNAWQHSRW